MQARPRTSQQNVALKPRQMSQLHLQLAKLQANLADMENLVRVAAVQADYMKQLSILHGALFMANHRVSEEMAITAEQERFESQN